MTLTKGTRGRLHDGVLFGGIIELVITRVFKNGWLEARSDDGHTSVKVRHEDFIPEGGDAR